MSYHVHLTPKSKNAKTGPIPVSTTTALTCPGTCPFNHQNAGGCYAESGPLALHWRKVTAGERGMGLSTFAEQIAALPAGQLWRHNQAGDLPGDGDRIDSEAFGQITGANRGRRGFTYTHYPIRVEDGAKDAETAYHNRVQIIAANVAGFTVNLSANNVEHADQLADAVGDAAPVVTVLPSTVEGPEHIETPAGRRVVVCLPRIGMMFPVPRAVSASGPATGQSSGFLPTAPASARLIGLQLCRTTRTSGQPDHGTPVSAGRVLRPVGLGSADDRRLTAPN